MKFYRSIEYYKLHILGFDSSAVVNIVSICEKKINFGQNSFYGISL